jgi:hypothetical protein
MGGGPEHGQLFDERAVLLRHSGDGDVY